MEPTSRGVGVALSRRDPQARRSDERPPAPARPRHRADRAGALACAVGSGLFVAMVTWSASSPFDPVWGGASDGTWAMGLAFGLGVVTAVGVGWRLMLGLRR